MHACVTPSGAHLHVGARHALPHGRRLAVAGVFAHQSDACAAAQVFTYIVSRTCDFPAELDHTCLDRCLMQVLLHTLS